ncbi:MAG: hypothetical protein NC548_19850, partial [Lachnospiraceae bacterium]|nr:hypothetical protein [Lachnospiraceae bacterium]
MKKYTMNGKTYTKLTAIADELGLSRIRPSQFSKYGITEVTDDPAAVPAMAPVAATIDTQADIAPDATDTAERSL